MNKKIMSLIIILTLVFLFVCPTTLGKETAEIHTITINEGTGTFSVTESLSILGEMDEYYETLSFWIASDHTDLEILIDGKEPNSKNLAGQNIYECNVTGLEILKNETTTVDISYNLLSTSEEIQVTLKYDTTFFSTTYKNEEILSGSSLSENSVLTIKLTEDITTVTKDADTTMYIVVIVLLVIILLIVIIMGKKNGKTKTSSKITETKTGSNEYLTTKKALLMESLKEIEKKHRAKKISDDTYHKLKDRYKQEAVDVMKKLEDMK